MTEAEALSRRPGLDWATERFLALVLRAWNDLGASRHIGFGVLGCIPFESITQWATWNGLDREATLVLIAVIRKLDADRAERDEMKRRMESGS